MSEIKVNLDNLTSDEREQLLKLVEKGNKVESKVWIPKEGTRVWTIHDHGFPVEMLYKKWDREGYLIGQFYPTRKACEFAIEEAKVIKQLQDFADNNDEEIDWEDNSSHKYSIVYDYYYNKIKAVSDTAYRGRDVYFSSKEIIEKAIKTIGAERIKKYYLKIED